VKQRIIFHGRVQGVGFRQTTEQIARKYPVTGYVRNVPDGTVELVLSGDEESVQAVVNEVSQRFEGNITKRDESPYAAEESFSTFEVRM